MSAPLLNSAAPPGAGAVPGASTGPAAQAAQAAQAHGPLAGFEAMLAAFFGDQGLVAPGLGVPTAAGQVVAGQPGAAAAGKAAGKSSGGAGKDGAIAVDANKTSAGVNVADATANGVDAAMALVVPVAANAPQTATNAANADAAGQATDAGLGGKPSAGAQLAQLTAAVAAADAKNAKAAGVVAQDTSQSQSAVTPAQAAKANAEVTAKANDSLSLQGPVLSSQAAATGPNGLSTPPLASAATAAGALGKPVEPTGSKEKGEATKGGRIEGARTEGAPTVGAARSAVVAPAFADTAGKDASSSERDSAGPAAADAKPSAGDNAQAGSDFNLATNSTTTPNAAALAHAAALAVRGAPQTVANLAAQIAKKLDGRSSRFDVQLDPAGLGKVDVRVEIDAAGKMTAAMNFDNQQAANELKSRAGELQRALEQAGFDMSGGLSFDVAGQSGQGGRSPGQDANSSPVFRGRAFQAALDGGADAPSAIASSFSRDSTSGVDIRI